MSRTIALQTRWKALAPREQNLVIAAVALITVALLWWVALAPALQTLNSAPARHASLDAQLQRMQSLQAEAQQLKSAPRTSHSDAAGALRTAMTQRMGNAAQLSISADRATVTIKAVPAEALAQWLALARTNAHAVPVEARLTRSNATGTGTGMGANGPSATAGNAPPGNPGVPPSPRWDGTLVLTLPAR